jgi:glycosyltransferase involved in cell wall biosynthesis
MTNAVRRLLWLGTLYGVEEIARWTAASPAADRWQRGLLAAIAGEDVEVTLLGYLPSAVWPKGPAVVEGSSGEAARVSYVNLPLLREWSIGRALRRGALEHKLAYDAIVTYNAGPAIARTAAALKKHRGVPWVTILADIVGSEASQMERLEQCDGCIYLSWQAYQSSKMRKRLHLDGGVTRRTHFAASSRAVLYAGSLGPYGGIEKLLEAFALVRSPGAELWVCGKGGARGALRSIGQDRRVTYLGLLPDEELERVMERAAVFANPRAPHLQGNEHNFPSKLLEYLAHGKPIVSSWTGGLAPEYREVLLVPDQWSAPALARCLERALEMGPEDLTSHRERVEKFLKNTGRSWERQAQRMVSWLDTL